MARREWAVTPSSGKDEHDPVPATNQGDGMSFFTRDAETRLLADRYCRRLEIEGISCWLTTERHVFERWLGRPIASSYGGAYVYDERVARHLILINLARIDRAQPRAVEIVVAEELLHLRDRLDGDLRRHAKHGYDRIACRLATLVGVPVEEVRSCLVPIRRRPYRYMFRCSRCAWSVPRKKRGRWACPVCWRQHGKRILLREDPITDTT